MISLMWLNQGHPLVGIERAICLKEVKWKRKTLGELEEAGRVKENANIIKF